MRHVKALVLVIIFLFVLIGTRTALLKHYERERLLRRVTVYNNYLNSTYWSFLDNFECKSINTKRNIIEDKEHSNDILRHDLDKRFREAKRNKIYFIDDVYIRGNVAYVFSGGCFFEKDKLRINVGETGLWKIDVWERREMDWYRCYSVNPFRLEVDFKVPKDIKDRFYKKAQNNTDLNKMRMFCSGRSTIP